VKIVHDVMNCNDRDKVPELVLLILLVLFCKVDHNILLYHLETYVGVIGTNLWLLRFDLFGCCQAFSLAGELFFSCSFTFGDPPGSVIEPLLFCLYT